MLRPLVLAGVLTLAAIDPSIAQQDAAGDTAAAVRHTGGNAGIRTKTAQAKPDKIRPGKARPGADKDKASNKQQTPPPWAAVDPSRASADANQAAPSATAAPGSRFRIDPDAIDYGIKANGANVSAGQTRNQNYNGHVTGIGGELGMRLHF